MRSSRRWDLQQVNKSFRETWQCIQVFSVQSTKIIIDSLREIIPSEFDPSFG
jgi:hypothetical protein